MEPYQCLVEKKNEMAPTPRGRFAAVATHNIIILAVLMILRFRQRNRNTRMVSKSCEHCLFTN